MSKQTDYLWIKASSQQRQRIVWGCGDDPLKLRDEYGLACLKEGYGPSSTSYLELRQGTPLATLI